MYTIGKLAKKYGLSRSTLLYYDKIGLLRPSGHSKGAYRQYTPADAQRLAKICEYRKAGLALKNIADILDHPKETQLFHVLEQRLVELNQEMAVLRAQQKLVARLLGHQTVLDTERQMSKKRWTRILECVGFSEADMHQWHIYFERSDPQRHQQFLQKLNIPPQEISAIRALATAPHEIIKIQKESERFMKLFFKLYEQLNREGPGSFKMTQQAFELCKNVCAKPTILDLGCGSGGATISLAQLTKGSIVAIDIYQPYLDSLVQKATQAGVARQITVQKGDMAALSFTPEQFDIIWCEGAAYIMGVDAALRYWKKFVKKGGYVGLSDLVWLTDSPPAEVTAFWQEGYPAMRTAAANVAAAESLGYTDVGHFTIQSDCWVSFYADVEKRLAKLETTYQKKPDGRAIIEATKKEISLYRKYPNLYGFQFHVFQK